MMRMIRYSISLFFILAGTALAADPGPSSPPATGQVAQESAAPRSGGAEEMPAGMHPHPGMHGGMGMHPGMGGGGMGMHGPMGAGCATGGGMGGCMSGGCGPGPDTLAKQDMLQSLQEMVEVEGQLADLLKGKEKARVLKKLDEIGKRLERLQSALRSSAPVMQGRCGKMHGGCDMKHGGCDMKHGGCDMKDCGCDMKHDHHGEKKE